MSKNITVRAKSGGHELIGSGLAYTYSQGSGIELALTFEDDSELEFRFEFEKMIVASRT